MRKKYLALVLTGIILATVAMGCGSKKTPTENNEVTTPAPETSSDEYTTPDETTSYNNEETTEDETKPSEEGTTNGEIEEPTKENNETPTENPTKKPTEAPTEKPTVKPTEAPTVKPTVAPTQAPTQKPTEPPTTVPATYIKTIDGIPYTVDPANNKAYLEDFAIILYVVDGNVIPDTVHLQYEVDGYVVDYFTTTIPLVGLKTKNLYVDERIEKLFSFLPSAEEITDNIYWYNTNIENWNPGREHNIWFDSIGPHCTLHLAVNSTDLYVWHMTGFAPGSPDYFYNIKELWETKNRQEVAYRTFVCADGTYSFEKETEVTTEYQE